MYIRLILAFIRRDFLIEKSYGSSWLLRIAGFSAMLFVFFSISGLITPSETNVIEETGGRYFEFVLIGIIFSSASGLGLAAFSSAIRLEQLMGTLPALLESQRSPLELASGLVSSKFVTGIVELAIYLLLGVIFGANFSANWPLFVCVMFLTLMLNSLLGLLLSGIALLSRRGDVLLWAVGNLADIFSGVYFPVGILPDFLEGIARYLPTTRALSALRLCAFRSASVRDIGNDLLLVLLFIFLLWPLAVYFFAKAVRRFKVEGSLEEY